MSHIACVTQTKQHHVVLHYLTPLRFLTLFSASLASPLVHRCNAYTF